MRVINPFILLIICASFVYGATTGPKPCVTPGQTVFGPTTWTNQSNITVDDTSVANVIGESYYLQCTGFDFSVVPSTDVITGIVVIISKSASAVVPSFDVSVKIRQADGTFGGEDKSLPGDWNPSLTNYTYGRAGDTWGLTLTGADVNDSDFGVGIACDFSIGGGFGNVNYMSMEIFYGPNTGQIISVE